LVSDPLEAVYYALPFVAFGQGDCAWIPGLVSGCTSLPEFVFGHLREIPRAARALIIGYLAQMYGDRHCAHRVEQIGDCLVFGCEKRPEIFGWIKKPMVEKCWKMIDAETSEVKRANIAKVAARFYTIPPGTATGRLSIASKVDDSTLGSCIGGTIQGIADLLRNQDEAT
jgi:hypothetical protein